MSTSFRTVTVVKHPADDVWATMRDHLPSLAGSLADIQSIREAAREELGESVVRVVNEWEARVKLPAGLADLISTEMLRWTDHAEWDWSRMSCRWRVVPDAFRGELVSEGETGFEPIANFRATRITFSGAITLKPERTFLTKPLFAGMVQQAIASVIPRNFQVLCREVEEYIGRREADASV